MREKGNIKIKALAPHIYWSVIFMFIIGNDIGGTFTDTVLFNQETGEIFLGKVATTTRDPSAGVLTTGGQIFG